MAFDFGGKKKSGSSETDWMDDMFDGNGGFDEDLGFGGDGFSDRPGTRKPGGGMVPWEDDEGERRSRPRPVRSRRTGGFSGWDIPWSMILSVLLFVAVVALVVIFRYQIRAFLVEVISWAIIILIVVIAFRLVFRRRRRW